jgi:uncharacterized membrane protein YfcA
MTATEALALAAAAAIAGVMNALAGGGTLVTFPVLLLFNTPATEANATSTLALMLGMAGSYYGYRKQLETVKSWLRYFVPVSLIGGLIGSILLTRTSNETFSKLVPFLLLFASLLFLAQGIFRKFATSGFHETESGVPEIKWIWGAVAFQLAVAIYGGYFGAGIGILMLASLGFMGLHDIHQMNSLKTVLSSTINLVASAWFIWSGLINWPKAAVMTAAACVGYYLGSHFAQKIPQLWVRRIITGIGIGISIVMFYKEFLK